MRTNIGLSILIALSIGVVPPCASARLGKPVRPGDLLDESDVSAVVQYGSGCANGLRTLTVIRPIKGNLAPDTSIQVYCQSQFSARAERPQIVFLKYGAQAGTFNVLQEDEHVRAVRKLSPRPADADLPERQLGNEMAAVFLLTPDEAIRQVPSGIMRDVLEQYAMLESIYSSQAKMMYHLEPESVQSTLREISGNTALSPLQRLFSAAVLAWLGDVGSVQGAWIC